VGYEAMSVDN